MLKEFKLDGSEFIPLCDLMKAADLVDSGAVAKHLIADGQVKVNGEVELRKRCKIYSGSEIEYKGAKIKVI